MAQNCGITLSDMCLGSYLYTEVDLKLLSEEHLTFPMGFPRVHLRAADLHQILLTHLSNIIHCVGCPMNDFFLESSDVYE